MLYLKNSLQGKVKFLTGGKSPRASDRRQIRRISGADGRKRTQNLQVCAAAQVQMKEDENIDLCPKNISSGFLMSTKLTER